MAAYAPLTTTGQFNYRPAAAPTLNVPGLTQSPGTRGVTPSTPGFFSTANGQAAVSASGDVTSMLLEMAMNKAVAKRQQQIANESTKLQGVEFDKRYGWVGEGNAKLGQLQDQQFGQTNALEDDVFQHLMANDQAGFGENLSIGAKAFDDQNSALSGLMTAQKSARLEQLAASQAESTRQQAIQDQADSLAGALPGQIGFSAQEAGATDALAHRQALTAANTTGPADTPAYASQDPTLAAMFARQGQRGATEALTDSTNSNRLAATSDAFTGSERKLSDFATAVGQLTNKAEISRSALPAELQVGAVHRANAQDAYDFTSHLIGDEANQRQGVAQTYHASVGQAEQKHGTDLASVLANYFGGSMDSQNALTSGLVDASSGYENKRTALFNSKIAGATSSNPLLTMYKIAGNAARTIAGGGG